MPGPELPDDDESALPPKLIEALRYQPPLLRSDELPTVDREFLRQLVRKELSKEVAKSAHRLIQAFENWQQAFEEIIIEEFAKRQQQESKDTPSAEC